MTIPDEIVEKARELAMLLCHHPDDFTGDDDDETYGEIIASFLQNLTAAASRQEQHAMSINISEERIEARARDLMTRNRNTPRIDMRKAKLIAESQLRHEDALAAERVRGVLEGLWRARQAVEEDRFVDVPDCDCEVDDAAIEHAVSAIDARIHELGKVE